MVKNNTFPSGLWIIIPRFIPLLFCPGISYHPLAHFSWLPTGQECTALVRRWLRSLSLQELEHQNRVEVLNILIRSRTTDNDNHSWPPGWTAGCLSVQVLSSCQCIHKYGQTRTGYRMMMPAVPLLRLISAHTHTGWWGRGGTEGERDLWQLVAHWPQNKKALGLKSGFMGRQCVSDEVRLNAWASVGFTVFSIKSDWQFVSSLPLFLLRV